MKRKNIFWILIILAVLFAIIFIGRRYILSEPILSSSKNMGDEISQIINKIDDNGQFSGAVLISVKGDIIYKNAVGYANLEDSIPNINDTKFRIASFTKPF